MKKLGILAGFVLVAGIWLLGLLASIGVPIGLIFCIIKYLNS